MEGDLGALAVKIGSEVATVWGSDSTTTDNNVVCTLQIIHARHLLLYLFINRMQPRNPMSRLKCLIRGGSLSFSNLHSTLVPSFPLAQLPQPENDGALNPASRKPATPLKVERCLQSTDQVSTSLFSLFGLKHPPHLTRLPSQ